MNDKRTFETPVIEIEHFGVEDIITTSGGGGGIELPDHEWE